VKGGQTFAFLPTNKNNSKTSCTSPSALFQVTYFHSPSLSIYQNQAAPIALIQIVDVEKRRRDVG
jgi:hypothetical protein